MSREDGVGTCDACGQRHLLSLHRYPDGTKEWLCADCQQDRLMEEELAR